MRDVPLWLTNMVGHRSDIHYNLKSLSEILPPFHDQQANESLDLESIARGSNLLLMQSKRLLILWKVHHKGSVQTKNKHPAN